MDEHAEAPLYVQEKWPEDYAHWAKRLWEALTPALKEPKSLGWGSADFETCDVVLELSSHPERRLTIRVIDALPDHENRCYHGYHWGMGPWTNVDPKLAVDRVLIMAEQLQLDAQKREFR